MRTIWQMSPGLSALLLALLAAPLAAQENAERPSPPPILAILAHPDDEITIAPVLSRAAREGGEVTLIFATSGDEGPGVSGLQAGPELAERRETEARCAAFILGVPEPTFWQLGDGQLGIIPRAPDSAAKRLAELVRDAITEQEPRVVMTFGPDGGYGHGDHRMVSAVVTEIVQSLGDPRPDLLYMAIPAMPAAQNDELGELSGPLFEGWSTTHPDLVTDRLRYETADLDATRDAVQCYESQFAPEVQAGLADLLHRTIWRGMVHFRLAFATRH